jgi:hypothetical protein
MDKKLSNLHNTVLLLNLQGEPTHQSQYDNCSTDCFIADVSYRETGKDSNRNAKEERD